MKRRLILAAVLVGVYAACAMNPKPGNMGNVLFAQSLPTTVHAVFAQSVSGGVVDYKIVTDGGAPVIAPLTACVSGTCTVTVPINAWGNHSTVVYTRGARTSDDPTFTEVPTAAHAWSLNQDPVAVDPNSVKMTK